MTDDFGDIFGRRTAAPKASNRPRKLFADMVASLGVEVTRRHYLRMGFEPGEVDGIIAEIVGGNERGGRE